MEKATIPLIAFTSDTVSRLTELSIRQLHYWDRQNFFRPSFADPNRRRPHSRVYSFTDLVGLRTVAELRRKGVSWPELKRVRDFFGRDDNVDWANQKFYVVGQHVYFTHEEMILAARPLGQRVDPSILELGPIVKDMQRAVAALPTRTPDQFGRITRDRMIMNGRDVVAGTRIPTATIAWFRDNNYSDEEILNDFPRLTWEDIAAAIAHEKAKRQQDGVQSDAVA